MTVRFMVRFMVRIIVRFMVRLMVRMMVKFMIRFMVRMMVMMMVRFMVRIMVNHPISERMRCTDYFLKFIFSASLAFHQGLSTHRGQREGQKQGKCSTLFTSLEIHSC